MTTYEDAVEFADSEIENYLSYGYNYEDVNESDYYDTMSYAYKCVARLIVTESKEYTNMFLSKYTDDDKDTLSDVTQIRCVLREIFDDKYTHKYLLELREYTLIGMAFAYKPGKKYLPIIHFCFECRHDLNECRCSPHYGSDDDESESEEESESEYESESEEEESESEYESESEEDEDD